MKPRATERRWHGIDVRAPAGAMEFVVAALWDHPLLGLEEDPEDPGHVLAFRETPWDAERLAEDLREQVARAGANPLAVRVQAFTVEDEDWLRVWKEGWRPTELGRLLLVLPAWWTEPVAGARIAVRIDPGRAFGTGTHVSTALAWELLEPHVADTRRLLDVGSGSGVLALGALAYASSLRAVLTEADRDAIPSLLENLALNAARGRAEVVHCTAVPFTGASFDLAVANLTAREHVAIDHGLHRVLAPGARVVLSGLRDEQAAEASARWRDRGYTLETELLRDTWVAFRWRRP
jgi:ribosomal protein L11 methyltransferase